MQAFLKWLAVAFARHFVIQLIFSPAFAYLSAWAIALLPGMDDTAATVPPLFLPILSGTVVAITLYPGFVAPAIERYQRRKNSYRNRVNAVYIKVSGITKPEILNPNDPGNPAAMKELAQREVDLLRPILMKKRVDVPLEIDVDDEDSLWAWYAFLRDERVRAANGK